MRYRFPRFRGEGQNQRFSTFGRHKSTLTQNSPYFWSFQYLEQDLMRVKMIRLRMLVFLG